MQNPVVVEEVYRRSELEEEGFSFRREEGLRHVFLEGFEVVLEEIHDEEDAGLDDQPAALGSGPGWGGSLGAYSFMLSPMTTSLRFTMLVCRDAIRVWISRKPVTGNPSFELSILSFFKATISPVAVSLALDTHP